MLLSGGTNRWAPKVSQFLWAWVVIKEPVPKPFWLSVSSWTRLCFVYSGDWDGRGTSCSSVSGPNWDNRTEVGDAEPDGGHGYKIGEHICRSCLPQWMSHLWGHFVIICLPPAIDGTQWSLVPSDISNYVITSWLWILMIEVIPRPQPANEVRS